jgi:hypothetical protein
VQVADRDTLCHNQSLCQLGKFGVNGSDLQSSKVLGNVVVRCGGNGYLQQQPAMMMGNGGDGQSVGTVANAYCALNFISNALYSGASFTSSTNIVFQRNIIVSPELDGITVGPPSLASGVMGFAIINSNCVSGLSAGHSAFTNAFSGYTAIVPIMTASYTTMSGVATEACSEGGQDLTGIANGDWAAYGGINLNGLSAFAARGTSAGIGGNIEIHLDSPGGTLAGVCSVPGTAGWQNFTDAFCSLTNATGTHKHKYFFAAVRHKHHHRCLFRRCKRFVLDQSADANRHQPPAGRGFSFLHQHRDLQFEHCPRRSRHELERRRRRPRFARQCQRQHQRHHSDQ